MSTALQSANYIEKQPQFPEPHIREQEWFKQPPYKKPPSSVGDVKQVTWDSVLRTISPDEKIKGLDDSYVIENRRQVARFIEENGLHTLLLQAKEPLKTKFGERSIKQLSIVVDDEGFESLFCMVLTSGDLQQNRHALRAFDREWWLPRVEQAGGRLSFDFQVV